MTEGEWLSCQDPKEMLDLLRDNISPRRLLLFSVACASHVLHLMGDERSRRAVQVAGLLADGLITPTEAEEVGNTAAEVSGHDFANIPAELGWRAARAADHLLPLPEESYQLRCVWEHVTTVLEGEQLIREGATPERLDAWSQQSVESGRTMGWTATNPDGLIADILRDVVGLHPWRPSRIDTGYATRGVQAVATRAYTEGLPDGHLDPALLVQLAAALEAGGCGDAELLGHLRGPGPHYRGCFAVDLVLGKQ